jgi:hypothetical protein
MSGGKIWYKDIAEAGDLQASYTGSERFLSGRLIHARNIREKKAETKFSIDSIK